MKTRHEGIVAFLLWMLACVWTITACWYLGYVPASVALVGGIPKWILYGVFLPWVTMFVLHSLYSWFLLGRGRDGE